MVKCEHGYTTACLLCGFGELDGQRVWHDWAWKQQLEHIEELKAEIKAWKLKSMPLYLNGSCTCGEPLQGIISDREGYSLLHCFGCGKKKYELIGA